MPVLQKNLLSSASRQRGVALMLLLLLVSVGALAVFVSGLNRATLQLERDRITAAALAQAKAALIGYASSHTTRGRLPCPEDVALVGTPNEGNELSSCNSDGLRIGRLPWRMLGLGDLRDGYGERLWYVVSANFTNDAARINSDISSATISINGTINSAAMIFSPGPILSGQTRDSGIATCGTTGSTLRHDYCADNYLDVDVFSSISNRDGDTTFVQAQDSGLTSQSNDAFNDKLLSITPTEYFKVVENRVLRQVKACLVQYANDAGNTKHLYPWADKTDPTDLVNSGNYIDDDGVRTGRLARLLLAPNNPAAWNGNSCPLYCSPTCIPSSKNWFNDWKELVFYALSEKYSPAGVGDSAIGGSLLTVGGNANVRAAVFLAHPPLVGQSRSTALDKITRSYYLEGENANGDFIVGDDIYSDLPVSTTYNDRTLIVAP